MNNGSWQAIDNLTTDINYAQVSPSVAIGSNDVIHVTWYAYYSGSTTIYQIRYVKYNGSWQTIENLTTETYDQSFPVVTVDAHNYVHIVFMGAYSGSPTYTQVRHIMYNGSWQAIENVTNEVYNQQYPLIVIDHNDVYHVVFRGLSAASPTYYQIRYMKKTSGIWSYITDITADSASNTRPNLILSSRLSGTMVVYMYGTTGHAYCSMVEPFVSTYSGTDVGFLDSPDMGDTHPFTSATPVAYTVQSPITPGVYYWRVAAKDPSGANCYGNWTPVQSFTVSGMKIYNGSTWDYKPAKYYDGIGWTAKTVKVYNGTQWVIK
jgi:hypothetical protein